MTGKLAFHTNWIDATVAYLVVVQCPIWTCVASYWLFWLLHWMLSSSHDQQSSCMVVSQPEMQYIANSILCCSRLNVLYKSCKVWIPYLRWTPVMKCIPLALMAGQWCTIRRTSVCVWASHNNFRCSFFACMNAVYCYSWISFFLVRLETFHIFYFISCNLFGCFRLSLTSIQIYTSGSVDVAMCSVYTLPTPSLLLFFPLFMKASRAANTWSSRTIWLQVTLWWLNFISCSGWNHTWLWSLHWFLIMNYLGQAATWDRI